MSAIVRGGTARLVTLIAIFAGALWAASSGLFFRPAAPISRATQALARP
jgi:hypothetical protein